MLLRKRNWIGLIFCKNFCRMSPIQFLFLCRVILSRSSLVILSGQFIFFIYFHHRIFIYSPHSNCTYSFCNALIYFFIDSHYFEKNINIYCVCHARTINNVELMNKRVVKIVIKICFLQKTKIFCYYLIY